MSGVGQIKSDNLLTHLKQTTTEGASQTLSKKLNVTVNLNSYSHPELTFGTTLQKSRTKHTHNFLGPTQKKQNQCLIFINLK